MIRMTPQELTMVRAVAQAGRGALTIEQARGVAKKRSCPQCAGALIVDTDALGDDDPSGSFAFGRLLCLSGGHEIAKVKRGA